MSRRRPGTCHDPGPYATHCTEVVGHRYSCYDASDDSSWNDRSPEDWQTETPHDCGDVRCPDRTQHREPDAEERETPAGVGGNADAGTGHEGPPVGRLDVGDAEICISDRSRSRPTESTDRQTWERRLGGTDIAETRLHLDVDAEGRVRVHEAVLVQLLVDAGWERTA